MTSHGDRPRRVAYLLTQDRGGPVDVTVALALAVAQTTGWDVRLFGPRPARGAAAVTELQTELLVEGKGAVGAIRRARAEILSWRPDVVHAQDRRAGLVCAGLARRSSARGRPRAVVHTYHGVPDDVTESWFRGLPGAGPSPYTKAVLAGDAAVARTVTRTVVPASAMEEFLRERLRVPADRITHIDNGLPLPPASVPAGPLRRLLFVGLLVRRKGVHLLLEALAAVGPAAGLRLDVAGDGPERADLEALASRLGLGERVRFLGFRSDVPELLAGADAFVLPSAMEQQPLVLIEAMGAGKPIVGTDVGGVREMVGDAGLVVPPNDPEALAEALRRLTSSDISAWGRRARVRAEQRFTVEAARERHLALYEELTRSSEGPVR